MSNDLRYPIGEFVEDRQVTPAKRELWIRLIAEQPALLRAAVDGLTDAVLDTAYRPGGWTVRQVVHHVFDSHANAYIRFRLALTEDVPRIKVYDEQKWAELPDAKRAPLVLSLPLIDALHRRWVALLEAMGPDDFRRELYHPELGQRSLDSLLQMYAWHGRHHTAHITELRKRLGV